MIPNSLNIIYRVSYLMIRRTTRYTSMYFISLSRNSTVCRCYYLFLKTSTVQPLVEVVALAQSTLSL